MIIKKLEKQAFLLFFGLALMLFSTMKAWAMPPTALTPMVVAPSNNPGEITLAWVSPSGSIQSPYQIRIKVGTSPITTEAQWLAATPINTNPYNLTLPQTGPAMSSFTYTLTGLVAGTDYGLAVRYKNLGGNTLSSFHVGIATKAKENCTEHPNDGLGVATMFPSIIKAGEVTTATITYVTDTAGIKPGGKVAISIPSYLERPSLTSASNQKGHVSITTMSLTANLTVSTSNHMFIVEVATGPQLNSGDTINFHYVFESCDLKTTERMKVFSQFQKCGIQKEITSSPSYSVVNGDPDKVSIEPYEQIVSQNVITPIQLDVIDRCGRNVNATIPMNVNLKAELDTATGFSTDPDGRMSLTSSFATPFQNGSILINSSEKNAIFYYRITTTANSKKHYVSYTLSGNTDETRLVPVASGITNVSADTGTKTAGQTNITFTPNGDGTADKAYVNFSLPETLSYRVEFSSTSFTTIAKTLYGQGKNVRIAWLGDLDRDQSIANPAVYKAKIVLDGDNIKNDTINITLQANSVIGTVSESGGTPKISDAEIEIFGPTFHFTRTNSNGAFAIHGLQQGQSYNMRIRKVGFVTKEVSVTPPNGTLNLNNTELIKASILRVTLIRPSSTNLPPLWASIRANTSDWQNVTFESGRFAIGKTISDAGDLYNVTPTSYSSLGLEPDRNYTLHIEVPNHGVSNRTFNLTSGVTVSTTVLLTRRADLTGEVRFPSGENPNGAWVSVDACLDGDCSTNDPSKRFYGGVYVPADQSTGIYRVNGVPVGTYALEARTEGYVRETTSANVPGTSDVTANFGEFSVGSVINGNLTIVGDTTQLDDLDAPGDGTFGVYINAHSNTSFLNSFVEVRFSTSSGPSSKGYTLGGLEDGTYSVFTHIPGYKVLGGIPQTITISGGSVAKNLTFTPYSGSITGTIRLPSGAGDYSNVVIDVLSRGADFGVQPQATISGNTYTINQLDTDYYTIQAHYQTSKLTIQRNVGVKDGFPSTLDLDLSGDTYSITGRVVSSAEAPFNELSYIVDQTTPTTLYNIETDTDNFILANRIVAEKVLDRDFQHGHGPGNTTQGGGGGNIYDPKTTFFGFYDATTGVYTINNLSPGVYQLYNNGEMDNDTNNGREIAEVIQKVAVINANVTGKDFTLIDGFDISGTIRLSNAEPEPSPGRRLSIRVFDTNGNMVDEEFVDFEGTSGTFELNQIPPGLYSVSVNDDEYPIKYSAKNVSVEVISADVSGVSVTLEKASKIIGKLRLKKSGVFLTQNNVHDHLANQFDVFAQELSGGGHFRADFPILNAEDNWSVTVKPGDYEIEFGINGFIENTELAQGKKQYVSSVIGPYTVRPGETRDIGVIDLVEGEEVSGTIRDIDGNPISNVPVEVEPVGGRNREQLLVFTNERGEYRIPGIDPETRYYYVIAAPRPDDHSFFSGFTGSRYGEVRKYVDTANQKTGIDFVLRVALGEICAQVVTSDSGELLRPFGDRVGFPGAEVFANPDGNIPTDNPIADIVEPTDPDGNICIKGLLPGNYTLTAAALGYRTGVLSNIVVNDNTQNVGQITVQDGFTLNGTFTHADGSTLNAQEADVLVAVRNRFQEFIIGNFVTDSDGNILSYTMSGFEDGQEYSILAFGEDDESTLVTRVTLTGDTELDLVLPEKTPTVFAQGFREQSGDIRLKFEFTDQLRNSEIDLDLNGLADDSELNKIFTITGSGSASLDTDTLASNRQRAEFNYTPGSGETSFTVRVQATFNKTSDATGNSFTADKTFQFFVGIGNQKSKRLSNASPGVVTLDGDPSKFGIVPGTFGDQEDLEVEVIVRAAQTVDSFSASNIGIRNSGALSIANRLGISAYPSEMGSAMIKAKNTTLNPFSSFYDIFLPPSVSHFFPEGKAASLCLTYDTSVTDPSSLNIYYYNSKTNEYLLENTNRVIDTDNKLICVDISHASVFTVFASNEAILSGAGYTGPLNVLSFPNPFNLKSKTVTLQNPGTLSQSQTINGTMIKFSVPSNLSGEVEIEIYNVAGEKVRTLRNTVSSGGSHFYMEWDGKNDSGKKVASGSYIARFTIGGSNEKFFKMAVIK